MTIESSAASWREALQARVSKLADELKDKPPLEQVAEFKETFKGNDSVKIRGYADGVRLQVLLLELGFDPQRIDSWVEGKTKTALRAFKTDYNKKQLGEKIEVNDSFDKKTLAALELYCRKLSAKYKEDDWTDYPIEGAKKSGSYIRFMVHGEDDREPEKEKKIVAKHIIEQADKGMITLEEHAAEDEPEKPVLSDKERSRREIAEAKELQKKLAKGYSVTISGKPTEDEKRSRQEIAAATKRQKELASGQSVTIDSDPMEDDAQEATWPEYNEPDARPDSNIRY